MFRKDEPEAPRTSPKSPTPAPRANTKPSNSGVPSRIGSGLVFKGEVNGDEDLLIEGRLEGQVRLETRHVTIGKSGRVQGDVHAKAITVVGEVHGNLFSDSEVLVESEALIEGNLHSPRVNLKDGCRFQGSIDMSSGKKSGDSVDKPGKKEPAATLDKDGKRIAG